MITRKYIGQLQELAEYIPVIAIIGPRQVGKTTLAKEFSKTLSKPTVYIDLEKPSDYQKLQDAEFYLSSHADKCIIIDEIQVKPELFSIIRSLVDENRTALRFIVLGSASPEIIKNTSQTLAGRIAFVEVKPFSLKELSDVNLSKLHFFGGFPNSILASKESQSIHWLNHFIKTYIERDLPMLGLSSSPQTTRRLWEMLAWQNGNLINYSSIGNSMGLSNHTITKYVDFLEGSFMVNKLPSFHANSKKRLVKSHKLYISDTGLLHRLLRVASFENLLSMPVLGNSFEAFVIQNVLAEKSENIDIYFYRTLAGTEIDLVLAKSGKPIACAEIKFSNSPSTTKSLLNGIEDLGTKNNYIITPEADTYQIKDGITVCSVRTFITEVLPRYS